uniref:Organic cation transporter 1-like n=2 Tax=Hirondellea gigas TaxID=1518452 RepID=A0A6A7G6M1_9CRUS
MATTTSSTTTTTTTHNNNNNSTSRTSTRSRRGVGMGMAPPRFEQVLEKVGSDGRHQRMLLYLFLLPIAFYTPFGSSSLQLMLSSPDHHCKVPAREQLNVSRSFWRRITIPWSVGDNGRMRYSRCLMRNVTFSEDSDNTLMHINIDPETNTSCQYGYEYDRRAWDETATTEHDWVCGDSYIVSTIFFVALIANVIGTLLFSILSDRYGRKPLFFLCVGLSSVFGLVNLFSTNWQVFAVTKFFSSVPYFAFYQLPYIIVIEQSSRKVRGKAAALCAVAITAGVSCMALMAWLSRTWTTFGLICYTPGLLLFFYWRLVPESPRWLLSMGRVQECSSVLHKIACSNNKVDPPELLKVLCELQKEQRRPPGLATLVRVPAIRKRIIIVVLETVILCVVHSGIVFNIRNVSRNEFVNFFALSVVDVPGNILGMVSARFLGRRLTAVYTQCIAAGFCFFASVATHNWLALTVLCCLGKVFLTSAVVVVFMQVGELLPTPLRGAGYGITGAMGLAGTVAMHLLMAMGGWDPRLPYYILGLLCLLGGSISSLLPETLGRPLPQTNAEASSIGYGNTFCACIHHWNVHKQVHSDSEGDVDDDTVSCDNTTTNTTFLSSGGSFISRA